MRRTKKARPRPTKPTSRAKNSLRPKTVSRPKNVSRPKSVSRPKRQPRTKSPSRQTAKALTQKLRFESFLLELSAAFATVPVGGLAHQIEEWLGKVAGFIGVDRASLWELEPDGDTIRLLFFHGRAGTPMPAPWSAASGMKWLTEQFRRGSAVVWARIPDDIPKTAIGERGWAAHISAKSALGIPLNTGPAILSIVFTSVRHYRTWPAALLGRLRLVGEIFSNAVARQRAETALQSSESRHRAILKALPDLTFVVSPDGVYLDYSGDISKLFLPPEQFLGRRMDEVMPPDLATQFRAAFNQTSATGEVVEVEYQLPIGDQNRSFEARVVRREDGALVCVVRDMTDRVRALGLVRESEDRFRRAFVNSAIGMAITSLEGRWLQVNAALVRILGYSEEELLATTFQALTHPEDLEANLELLRRALAGKIDHYEMQKRYIHKDGRTISVLLTVSVVQDALRHPLYFVSQLVDTSERTQAQQELERLRLELFHSGRVALMGKLTASLAHELMQPIAAAVGNAEAGQRLLETDRLDANQTREILDDIVENCMRAANVVQGVRSLLRKEPKPRLLLDLNRLVTEVAGMMRSELISRQTRLTMRLEAELPEIMGHAVELQQVIVNLILNGADAMAAVAPPDRELLISTARDASGVELTVRDRGTGADPTHLRRMFEPFFTTKPDGIGMGLAICSDIISAHSGRLWAENNSDGAGVTVRCLLPLPESDPRYALNKA
jgi:PAS domain S-box-containing protein